MSKQGENKFVREKKQQLKEMEVDSLFRNIEHLEAEKNRLEKELISKEEEKKRLVRKLMSEQNQ